jgi:endonuclease-3 related protein
MPGLSASLPGLLAALGSPPAPRRPSDDDDHPTAKRLLVATIRHLFDARPAEAWMAALESLGTLDPRALAAEDPASLAQHYRDAVGKPASPKDLQVVRKTAEALQRLDDAALDAAPTSLLRDLLRSVRGLGPGAVDTLLLGALDRPVFPVSTGRYRILARHGWIDSWSTYDDASETVSSAASSLTQPSPSDALRDLGEGFDVVARRWCKPARALCATCPLEPFLPPGGAVVLDDTSGSEG